MKMRKLWDRVFIIACIYCNNLTTAGGPINYTYFSEGETVTLNCMSGADGVVWIGPTQNIHNHTPVPANDPFGTEKSWMTRIYTNAREINQDLPHNKRLRFVGSNESGDFNLEIRNMVISDVGYYKCAIYSRNEIPLHSKVYILLLKTLPTNITINNETEEETIIGTENEEMKLVCNVKSGLPPETILWKMNGSILKKGGPGRIVYQFNPNRTFHNLNVTCEIMINDIEKPITKSIRLDIKYKPEVLISHEPSGALFEGPKKKLCCEIDSNPNVIFMVWYKNSITQIKNNSSACLVLEKVTRQDSGNYTCFAGNEIGNGSSTASVVVLYSPTVSVEHNIPSIHENNRYVYCKADGVSHNFTFYRLEHKSHFNEHIRYLEVTSDGIAELPHTNQSYRYQDTGLYMCNASNGVYDIRGKLFQQGEAYLVYDGPPVFVADNRNIQYGLIGISFSIVVNIYSSSDINYCYLNGISNISTALRIKETVKKIITIRINFHGVNITAYGIQLTVRLDRLPSFQRYNVTVCNNFSNASFIVDVRQGTINESKEKAISSEGIGIVVLLILIVVLLVAMGIYVRNIKQRYRKRMITTANVQTADEVDHYVEIVEVNNELATLHDQNNQMISTDDRMIVETRNISIVYEEQSLAFSNMDNETSEHSIALLGNDSHTSEHLDDGYERPYTTLVTHNYAEEEHVYKSTKTNLFNDNTSTFENATYRPYVIITEQDVSLDDTKTHFFPDDSKENKTEYINLCLK